MLPNTTYKEARIASIEVLFHFFKAVPSSYYNHKEEKLPDGSIKSKAEIQMIKKELDKVKTGFDYIQIIGMYLSAYDQKVFRAIIENVYNQEEQEIEENLISAKSLNEEYISVEKKLYSNQANLDINRFYKILNPNTKTKTSSDIFEKIVNSLQRLAQVSMSFFTKNKKNIITAPLLIYSKKDNNLILQLHPAILSFQFESKNDGILKYKQNFYSLDNSEYYKLENDLQRLLYSKIQYKFASMSKTYTQCNFDFQELRSQIFLSSSSSKTLYNQSSKLKNAVIALDKNCSYSLKLEGTSKTLQLIVNK
jgi:hypothetical protein